MVLVSVHSKSAAADSGALPVERHKEILVRLRRTGRVLAAEMASEFGVSEHTIRRDLNELAAAGLCRRVYAGAVLLSPSAGLAAERIEHNRNGKQALGSAAARLVRQGQCIFLDASTTNISIAKALPMSQSVTAVTNCPEIATVLMSRELSEVILIGGRLNAHSGGATGAVALAQLQQIRFDLAFVGACAVEVHEGVTVFDSEDAAFKRTLIAASGHVAVALTAEKLGTLAQYRVAALSEIDSVIIESTADPRSVAEIRRAGPEVLIAR